MKNKLSENIRNLRKSRRLTQEQLAEAMGVSAGAVYKWEAALSVPDIEIIILLAEYFEVSVDVLLGYEMQSINLKSVLERLHGSCIDRDFEKGRQEAERALQKYPNNFQVVYKSAMVYFLSLEKDYLRRALELFSRSLELIDQNTDDSISEALIYSRMSHIHGVFKEYDKSIELLQKYNFDGHNEAYIGEILSRSNKYDEALPHLSAGLANIINSLLYLCSGYANAYIGKGEFQKARDMMLWLIDVYNGLRIKDEPFFLDKSIVVMYAACAQCCAMEDDLETARSFLKQAYDLALKFDASPVYDMSNQRFYHCDEDTRAYDSYGDTAVEAIINILNDRHNINPQFANSGLKNIWEEICNEEN